MSLTPAKDEAAAKRKREAIELCGKNRGPHDYIPIEWMYVPTEKPDLSFKRVTRLMCRTCFNNIAISVLISNYQTITD